MASAGMALPVLPSLDWQVLEALLARWLWLLREALQTPRRPLDRPHKHGLALTQALITRTTGAVSIVIYLWLQKQYILTLCFAGYYNQGQPAAGQGGDIQHPTA